MKMFSASPVTTLKQLIQKVEAGSNYRFSWSNNLPNDISISVPRGPQTVEALLNAALANKGVSYVIQQNDIVLLPQQKSTTTTASTASKQPKEATITGTVIDAETGAPVIGASIWIKNTTVGTTADMNGNFTMNIKDPNNTLKVSYIGYKHFTQKLGTKNVFKITLQDNTKTMTGKPLKMHLEHGRNMEKTRRASWVKDNLLSTPKVIKWTKEYFIDQYNMPLKEKVQETTGKEPKNNRKTTEKLFFD